MWEEILITAGSSAVLMGATAWLIRSLVIHLLSKDIETFKANLKAEAEKDLTELKSSLKLENTKLGIKLNALEDKRLEFIEKLYEKLVKFSFEAESFLVESLLNHDEESKKKANSFIDSYFIFYKYLASKSIYLPKPIENKFNMLHSEHMSAATKMLYYDEHSKEESVKYLKANSKKITESTKEILNDLADEFRKLIGADI